MMLKARVRSLTEAPEAIRSFYVPQDGWYVLQVEGMVVKEKLNEFRESNIALRKQIETLLS